MSKFLTLASINIEKSNKQCLKFQAKCYFRNKLLLTNNFCGQLLVCYFVGNPFPPLLPYLGTQLLVFTINSISNKYFGVKKIGNEMTNKFLPSPRDEHYFLLIIKTYFSSPDVISTARTVLLVLVIIRISWSSSAGAPNCLHSAAEQVYCNYNFNNFLQLKVSSAEISQNHNCNFNHQQSERKPLKFG